jgi:hypothetical protein
MKNKTNKIANKETKYTKSQCTSYWYVAPLSKLEYIRKNGIEAEMDGFIYLINWLEISEPVWGTKGFMPDFVANMVHGLSHYVLIEIDFMGINGETSYVGYDVSQSRTIQSVIAPEFLSLFQKRKTNVLEMATFFECETIGVLNGMHIPKYLKNNKDNLPLEIDPQLKHRIRTQKNYFEKIRRTISRQRQSNCIDEDRFVSQIPA